MIRYAVVRTTDMRQRLSVHSLFTHYDGESIDDQYVLVLAAFTKGHADTLDNHPDVLLTPSVISSETINAHAQAKGKMQHYAALQKLGVTDQHRSADLHDIAVKRYGMKMALDL